MEASQHSLTERGYELDREGQEAQNRANAAAVELERAAARERSNTERVAELEARHCSCGGRTGADADAAWPALPKSATQQRSFLETAAGEAQAFHQKVEARQHEARTAAEEVFSAERQAGGEIAAMRCTC